MKNKRLLVKRSQFCEQINGWLTEKLRQALNAEEVILTNGEFLIIEDYDVVLYMGWYDGKLTVTTKAPTWCGKLWDSINLKQYK